MKINLSVLKGNLLKLRIRKIDQLNYQILSYISNVVIYNHISEYHNNYPLIYTTV